MTIILHVHAAQSLLRTFSRWCVVACLAVLAQLTPINGMTEENAVSPPPLCSWNVHKSYPHDRGAFTQGLQYHKGSLYEGTGLYGESTLREVELESGRVLRSADLDQRYFGEGITILGDSVYQLTWREQTAFRYRLHDFSLDKKFRYDGEGWGLTHNGRSLIMSDGTPEIRFINPDDFSEISRITVRTHKGPVPHLNELEYIDGAIYANVWQTAFVLRINPESGDVTGVFDLGTLLQQRPAPGVLNGIARIPNSDQVLLTGKNWPLIFAVTLHCP